MSRLSSPACTYKMAQLPSYGLHNKHHEVVGQAYWSFLERRLQSLLEALHKLQKLRSVELHE
jgi:hypothetical protein